MHPPGRAGRSDADPFERPSPPALDRDRQPTARIAWDPVSLFSLVLTPLRPGAALVRPATALARPIGAAISVRSPLSVVGQMATDVRSIAASTNELTVAVEELDAIRRRVDTLEVEVIRMRQAVEEVVVEVSQVREQTAPLGRLAGRFGRRDRKPPVA